MNIEEIKEGIESRAKKVAPLGNSLKFDFGGEIIYLDGTGESNTVNTEDKEADCTIKMTPDNLLRLIKGKLNPLTAVMTGKIKISGDMSVAMKLQPMFS